MSYTPYICLDTDAYYDPKVVNARIKHGPVAFTIFVFLLSMMSNEETCMLSCKDYAAFAHLIGIDEETVKSVVEDFGLFEVLPDSQFFFSMSLSRRIEKKKRIAEERRAAANKRWHRDGQIPPEPDKPGGGSGRPRRAKKSQPAPQVVTPQPAEKTTPAPQPVQVPAPEQKAEAPATPAAEAPQPSCQPLTVADEVARLRNRPTWMAGVCKAYNLTPEQFDKLLEEFVMTCTKPTHGGEGISLEAQLQDCQAHIYHWLAGRLSRKTAEPVRTVVKSQADTAQSSDFGEAARQRRAAEAEERQRKRMSCDDFIRSKGYDPDNGVTLAMVMSPAWRAENPPTIAV